MAREMKDSGVKWIGEIPRKWSVSKIKFLIANGGNSLRVGPFGSSLSGNDFTNEGYWVYNQRSVIDNNFEDNDTFICENKYNELKGFRVYPHDILITTRGSIGKVAIVPDKHFEGILHPCIIRFVLNDEKYNKYFLKHIFNGTDIVQQQIKNKSNSTTIDVLYSATLKNLVVPLPPLPEQQTIADFLDAKCAEIDGLLADLETEVKTLAEYKKSIIAETVTRGLNPNAPMKQSGIPWAETIPAHWVSEKFRYKLKVRRVTGQGDKQVLSVYREYGVVSKDSRDDNHNVTSEDTSKYKYVRPNDFVINKMKAWQGSMGVSDHEGIVSPAYFVYGFSDDNYNPRYFHYFMRNANNIPEYRRLSGGIREGQWDLSPYDLGNMPVIVPPKAEQNEIVAYLDEKCALLDKSTADKQTQIETLKAYKSSLIYEYVTGKKQVI